MTEFGSSASFRYDLGYIDLEQRTLQTIDNPVRHEVVTHVLGTLCNPCLRIVQRTKWRPRQDSNL